MREPGVGAIIVAEITESRDEREHARRLRGLHVALGITDVNALARRHAHDLRGVEQRARMRLALRKRIATDDGASARMEIDFDEQRFGKPAWLVCHDAPGETASLELEQH